MMQTQPTALAQLRHLYQNMLNGGVRDTASAKRIAEGLLGPAIEALERGTPATGGKPLTDEQVRTMIDSNHGMPKYPITDAEKVCLDWYRLGLRDGEQAHGIGITGGQA